MTYIDEVLDIFVTDVSTKLNIDFSWMMSQSNDNILAALVNHQDKIAKYLNIKSLGHNVAYFERIFDNIDIFSDANCFYQVVNTICQSRNCNIDLLDMVYVVINNKTGDIVISDSVENIRREYLYHQDIKSLAQLAAEKYLINNQKIIISLDFFEKAKSFWQKKAAIGEKAAQLFFDELALANFSDINNIESTITYSNNNERNLKSLASYFLIAESKLLFSHQDKIIKKLNASNLDFNDLLSYFISRSIIEIRLAWLEKSIDFSDRLKRVIDDTTVNFKDIFDKRISSFSASIVDYIISYISGFFKNIYQEVKKGGKYFKIICDEMWLFISNQDRTLLQTVVSISKAVASLALLTFTFGLHQYFLSVGLPESLVIVLVAFISSLATVAIFRLIEQAAQITGGIFYKRDVAKVRREEVERVCAELLPLIEEKVRYLDFLIEQEDIERTTIFNKSFTQIKESLASNQIDEIISAYEELYIYLGKELPFRNEKEFDDFMMDGNSFIL
jgi:hypothetical protein